MIDREQWLSDFERWGLWRCIHIRVMSPVRPWLVLCRVTSRMLRPAAKSPDTGNGRTARIATRSELMLAARDPVMGLRPESIDAALERGDMCSAVFEQERMLAYSWRAFSTAPHVDGLWVTFERPYRYGYKSLTHPDYRGQHLQSFASPVTDAACIERGYLKSLGFVESHNYASITNSLRLGNRLVGWAGYIKFFGRVFPFRSPGARKHTFRFVRSEARPA